MKGTSVLLNTHQKQLEVIASNLERAYDPSASRIDPNVSVRYLSQGVSLVTVGERRAYDPFLDASSIPQIGTFEYRRALAGYTKPLQELIDAPVAGDPRSTQLVNNMQKFFASAGDLRTQQSRVQKQNFVAHAQKLASTISNIQEKTDSLRLQADSELQESLLSTNNNLKALFNLNQQMLTMRDPHRVHDQRDSLVRNIAANLDIKVSYGHNGIALVQTKTDSKLLVTADSYAKFAGSTDETKGQNNVFNSTIIFNRLDSTGQPIHAHSDALHLNGTSDKGRWSALLHVQSAILPQFQAQIKSLASNFAEQVNKIHNDGTSIPPKTRFESSKLFSGHDTVDFDNFNIYFVDKNGQQLSGGAGVLNAAIVDVRDLRNMLPNGQCTIADVIKELNEKMSSAPSRERAAIGGIQDKTGAALAGEFLLNNIQLRAKTAVNPLDGNSFTFDLDLQGSSHFGSQIEVLGVTVGDIAPLPFPLPVPNYTVPLAELPTPFRLEKGVNIATRQNIKVQNIDGHPGQMITLQIRVTGDNGTISTGAVSFPANVQANINDRISYDTRIAGSVIGDFNNNLTSHTGVARAKLVDTNNQEISPNSGILGKLVIETNHPDYSTVFQGGDFSANCGLNNLFIYDDVSGKISVSQNIVDNPDNLAIDQISFGNTHNIVYKVGNANAAAKLTFSNIAAGVDVTPADGSTITIAGIQLTFVNAAAVPPLPNQVVVGDGLQGLVNVINNHPQLKTLVTAQLTAATDISITAKAKGTSGNNINIAFDLVGDNQLSIAGAVALNAGANNLADGTDQDSANVPQKDAIKSHSAVMEAISQLPQRVLKIGGNGNNAIPDPINITLPGLVAWIGQRNFDQNQAQQNETKIAESVLRNTHKTMYEANGINSFKLLEELLAAKKNVQFSTEVIRMLSQTENDIIRILFS